MMQKCQDGYYVTFNLQQSSFVGRLQQRTGGTHKMDQMSG